MANKDDAISIAIYILSELKEDFDNLSDKDILRAIDAAVENLKAGESLAGQHKREASRLR